MNRRGRAWLGQRGTAALETMVVMSFLFTLIFGFVHICLFVVTKSMANYAAFTAMRTSMVGGQDQLAARQVMSEMQWWRTGDAITDQIRGALLVQSGQQGPRHFGGKRRKGVRVSYLLPFGYPMFSGGLGLVRVIGFAPAPNGNDVPEEGDNK